MRIVSEWQLSKALADIAAERYQLAELRTMVRQPAPAVEHVDTPAGFIAGVAL